MHTKYSFDAYFFGTTATSNEAYQYAKGAVREHLAGFDMLLRSPLVFFAVTDHAIFMRQMAVGAESQNRYSRYSLHDPMRGIHSSDNEVLESTIVKASLFNAFLSQIVRSPVFGSGYSRRGHLGV